MKTRLAITSAITMVAAVIFIRETRAMEPPTLLWSSSHNSPANSSDEAWSVAVDGSGNVVVAGFELRSDLGQDDNWRITKWDPTLTTVLGTTAYNSPGNSNDRAYSVAVDWSGNVVVAGYENRFDLGQDDNWRITKWDPTLTTVLSTTTYNSPGNNTDHAYSVAVDGSGNVVVAGDESRPDLGQSWNWRITKWDPTLTTVLSTTTYNSPGNNTDQAYSVAVDGSGNVVVAGDEARADLGQAWNWRITKWDPTLTTVLSTTAYNSPGNSNDNAYSVAVDGSGNVVVAGNEDRSGLGQSYNWRITKWDPTLTTILSTTSYNSPGNSNDQASAVMVDGSGNVVVAGYEYRNDLGQSHNWRITMWDPTLTTVLSTTSYNSPGDSDDFATAVAVNGIGTFAVVGTEDRVDLGQFSNWLIRKYTWDTGSNGVTMDPLPVLQARSIASPIAFPIPFRPAGYGSALLKFAGLPIGAMVKVYSLPGLLLWHGAATSDGICQWDGRVMSGRLIEPGVYFWLAEAPGFRHRSRLVVER